LFHVALLHLKTLPTLLLAIASGILVAIAIFTIILIFALLFGHSPHH
jgi:hypothetical protein